MFNDWMVKALALFIAIGAFFAGIAKIKHDAAEDREDKITAEANEELLKDIERKNEIAEEVHEEIANSTDSERINRLLGKSDKG